MLLKGVLIRTARYNLWEARRVGKLDEEWIKQYTSDRYQLANTHTSGGPRFLYEPPGGSVSSGSPTTRGTRPKPWRVDRNWNTTTSVGSDSICLIIGCDCDSPIDSITGPLVGEKFQQTSYGGDTRWLHAGLLPLYSQRICRTALPCTLHCCSTNKRTVMGYHGNRSCECTFG